MKEEKALGPAPANSQWTCDSDFRRLTHSINGAGVAYGYDSDSLLTQAGAATLIRLPATGQVSSVSVGVVTTAVTYNQHGELEMLAATANGTALYSEGLSRDAAGRISVLEDIIEGTPVQWVFVYDKVGQLTSASRNGGPATMWSYDGNGNRIMSGGVVSTFDAQDRLQTEGSSAHEWDALGGRSRRTASGGVTSYIHDGLGALLSVTPPGSNVLTWDYDGRHRRVAKRQGGAVVKRWIYDGQYRVAAEVDSAGSITSRFVYGSQSHSPDYLVRAGVTYAYVKNHLGSIRLVMNAATGVVLQRLDYDPWGSISADSNPGFQPFAFAGGIYDSDTGLTHFGYRDYDARVGVWTAKDPIRLRGGLNGLVPLSVTR